MEFTFLPFTKGGRKKYKDISRHKTKQEKRKMLWKLAVPSRGRGGEESDHASPLTQGFAGKNLRKRFLEQNHVRNLNSVQRQDRHS